MLQEILLSIVAAGSHASQAGLPKLIHRAAQPYVSIRSTETLQGMATVFHRLMPKLMAWAAANHVKPSGPEFIRFNVIDMAKGMEIELGFPVTATVRGSGEDAR